MARKHVAKLKRDIWIEVAVIDVLEYSDSKAASCHADLNIGPKLACVVTIIGSNG